MKSRTRTAAVAIGACIGLGLISASAASAGGSDDNARILRAPLIGSLPSDPALFTATAGGAPWVITSGLATVRNNGRVDVDVTGLIIPNLGSNPVGLLAASVACGGAIVATTPTVPFSPAGDAEIHATVTIPDRCLAPAVLLSPNGNKNVYIGVTGG